MSRYIYYLPTLLRMSVCYIIFLIFFFMLYLINLFTFWYFHVTSIKLTVRHVAVIDQQPMFPLYVWYPFLYGFFDQFFSLQALVSQQIFQERNYISIIHILCMQYTGALNFSVHFEIDWEIYSYTIQVKILIDRMISNHNCPLKSFHETFIQFFSPE